MNKKTRLIKTMIVVSITVVAGSLGLHSAFSGQLDTPAPPGPTMYTLEEMYNSRVWKMMDKTFVNYLPNTRFAIHDPATPGDNSDDLVLDKETGLIWARDADLLGALIIDNAVIGCRGLTLGNRMGWRLPSIEELSSLLDTSSGSPKLPASHPFEGVQNNWYWTDITIAGAARSSSYGLNMTDGSITLLDLLNPATTAYVWPVWGGKSPGF